VSAPATSRTGADLYEALGAFGAGDEERGWPLLVFCGIFGQAFFEQIATYVQDTDEGPGWSIAFDVERCPAEALPYLAQYVGVGLNSSMSEDAQRDAIRNHKNFGRGRPAAIVAAAAATLRRGREVILTERDGGSAWRIRVRTLLHETPDPDVTEAAILAQIPMGDVLIYEVVDGQSWQDVLDSGDGWDDVLAGYDDWRDVENTLP
jgi:hypothetical protein